MLLMAALELGDPVAVFILMEAGDSSFHGLWVALAILNERDDVAVDIAHMKVDAAPGLRDEPLRELHAAWPLPCFVP